MKYTCVALHCNLVIHFRPVCYCCSQVSINDLWMLDYVYTVHQTLFSKQQGKSCFPRYAPYKCFMFGGGGVGWGCWGCHIALKPQYSPLPLARSGSRLDGNRWADRWRPTRRPRPRLDRQSPGREARCSPPQWFQCCWGPGWSSWALLVTVPTQSVSLALGYKLKRENFFCDLANNKTITLFQKPSELSLKAF